jgi:hypothetical protein
MIYEKQSWESEHKFCVPEIDEMKMMIYESKFQDSPLVIYFREYDSLDYPLVGEAFMIQDAMFAKKI